MMEQTPQTVNEPVNSTGCCPPFDPAQWDEKEIVWHDKKFVTDHILSLFHMPLTLNGRVKKNGKLIINAGADIPDYLMLIDENSKWGAEMYIEVLKDVPLDLFSQNGTILCHSCAGRNPYCRLPLDCFT